MMKHVNKYLSLALALVLCLSLAACGNSDNVAGDDWRTTGMVVGSGTITHDGESVDVLVTVSESSAASTGTCQSRCCSTACPSP